jgi:OOP family OmpA-OmpF porin
MPLYGVHFEFAKSTLMPAAEVELTRLQGLLLAGSDLVLEIEGHTDSVGGDAANLALSEARAKTVVDWLTAHEIVASRLSPKGLGETKPRAGNDTAAGSALYRRVELH